MKVSGIVVFISIMSVFCAFSPEATGRCWATDTTNCSPECLNLIEEKNYCGFDGGCVTSVAKKLRENNCRSCMLKCE